MARMEEAFMHGMSASGGSAGLGKKIMLPEPCDEASLDKSEQGGKNPGDVPLLAAAPVRRPASPQGRSRGGGGGLLQQESTVTGKPQKQVVVWPAGEDGGVAKALQAAMHEAVAGLKL